MNVAQMLLKWSNQATGYNPRECMMKLTNVYFEYNLSCFE